MPSCIRQTVQAFCITKAIITRIMFSLHGLVCIWRVAVTKQQPWYWCLVASLVLLIVETVFTLKKKKGGEWKWFCPSVFLYLTTTLPAIWFLELDLLDRRIQHKEAEEEDQSTESDEYEDLNLILGKINFHLPPDDWVKILEQLLLLVLIIGRWLLPKGEITREQLSQLLLVYIGMAADIIELFEAFKEQEVKYNRKLTMIILALWTASLLQFCFVLSAAKARKSRPTFTKQPSRTSIADAGRCFTCRSEILSIMTTIVLQDGSFLVLRMMLIFRYNVVSYTNIFFTAKNTLVNVLQLYRLVVLYAESVKLIKRQKSDPLIDEVFLIKAGILANKIAAEQEMRQRKEHKHVHVQTVSSNTGDDSSSSNLRNPVSTGQMSTGTSLPVYDAVIIENPMNNVNIGDKQNLPGSRKGKLCAKSKHRFKGKKTADLNLAREIMSITKVSLNPAKEVDNVKPKSSDLPEMDMDEYPKTKGEISDKNPDEEKEGVQADSGNFNEFRILVDGEQTGSGSKNDSLQDLLTVPSTTRKKKFKGVVRDIMSKRGAAVKGEASENINLAGNLDSLACPHRNANTESDSSQEDLCFGDSRSFGTEVLADVEVTIETHLDPELQLLELQGNDLLNPDQEDNGIIDFNPGRKKTKWRWWKAKAVGMKKCSDLNQNSTDQIPTDIELLPCDPNTTEN